jgi:hypothetical protein
MMSGYMRGWRHWIGEFPGQDLTLSYDAKSSITMTIEHVGRDWDDPGVTAGESRVSLDHLETSPVVSAMRWGRTCSGVAARWCPVCGDCLCDRGSEDDFMNLNERKE